MFGRRVARQLYERAADLMGMDFHAKGANWGRQQLSDIEDIVKRIIAGVSATVAAQKDGTVVSDQHRVLNFQGPGVTVTDDTALRRTNVYIPGAPTTSAAGTPILSTAGVGLMLRSATTPAPDGAGKTWRQLGYTTTGWTSPVANTQGGASYTPMATATGATWISESDSDRPTGEVIWHRREFTLPAGQIASAELKITGDNIVDIYLNDVFIANFSDGIGGAAFTLKTYALTQANLIAGANNILAFRVENTSGSVPNPLAIIYRLTPSYSTPGADTRYQLLAEKGTASGYAGLDAGVHVPTAQLGTGAASGSNFLRGDQTWAVASTNSIVVEEVDGSPSAAITTFRVPNSTLVISGSVATYTPAAGSALAYVNVQDQQSSGTAGGGFTSGSYQTRTLNTLVTDTGGIASLASNRITLPAGTYQVAIHSTAFAVDRHKLRLQDITNSVTLLVGQPQDVSGTSGTTTAEVFGVITLTGSTAMEVQHRCQSTRATDGFGTPSSFGDIEVYTIAEFWKRT
jgi:hypothetical protein